jgi:putative tryptophan/tyrosine transport system substrate-binding protein
MKRREFIVGLGDAAAAWPFAVEAQPAAMLPTIGFLGAGSPLGWSNWISAFLQRLHELGWVEDRTFVIEYRWAEGRSERYAEIAAEFVRAQGRSYCVSGQCCVRRQGSDCGHPDRVHTGGRSAWRWHGREFGSTGRKCHGPVDPGSDLAGKLLEFLREVIPSLRRLAILAPVGNLGSVRT